jgi:hypothetical protein
MNSINRRIVEWILENYPETRDSFESFLVVFIDKYLNGKHKFLTGWSVRSLSRIMRYIQNTEKRYVPSERVKEARNELETAYRQEFVSGSMNTQKTEKSRLKRLSVAYRR